MCYMGMTVGLNEKNTCEEFSTGWALSEGFPGGSDGKESACSAGDPGSIPGSGRSPGERNDNPLQYPYWEIPWTEELVGYSPWGPKELDMT